MVLYHIQRNGKELVMNRAIIVVADSVGIGALPDAADFGDSGANTLRSAVEKSGAKLPVLSRLGMGCIDGVDCLPCCGDSAEGAFGRAAEASVGKDTTTGHWEIAGVHSYVPFNTYPNGFPSWVIEEFERRTGKKTICNMPASGTEILKELGKRHMETGELIVYTSADSVFQIAAHEDVVSLDELYRCCEIAREILTGEVSVARVIARPFIGSSPVFERTPNRRDYSVKPPEKTLLDYVFGAGLRVAAVGKISDIFDGEGITHSIHTVSNMDGMEKTLECMRQEFSGLIFTNLVDFDSKYGHRRDPAGYGKALQEFDSVLPKLMAAMRGGDLLIVCADHGNDPCYFGTDHTREYIPIIAFGEMVKKGANIGTRSSFSDIGATVAEYLGVKYGGKGTSFWNEIAL